MPERYKAYTLVLSVNFFAELSARTSTFIVDELGVPSKVLNQGMLLSLTDEITSVARIAIYNSTVQNKDFRPRLKLYFIQKK